MSGGCSRRARSATPGGACCSGLACASVSEPDGYWDYEALGPREFQPTILEQNDAPAPAAAVSDAFPAVALLGEKLKTLPADVPVVLVVPPTYPTPVAHPGTAGAAKQPPATRRCKRLVAGRPHSNFINYRVDNALTRDRANFMDFGTTAPRSPAPWSAHRREHAARR